MELKELLKPEALQLFLFFVAPGFWALQVYDIIVPSERRNFGEALIQVVTYGLMSNILFYWLYQLGVGALNNHLPRTHHANWNAVGNGLLTIGYVFLAPAVLAVLVYRARTGRRGPINGLLRLFGIRHVAMDPLPTAWDKYFSRRDPCAMIFHLKDDKGVIAGAFGSESYASAYPASQQVYLEQQLKFDETTRKLSLMDIPMGVIINFEECEYIETVPLASRAATRPRRRLPWQR